MTRKETDQKTEIQKALDALICPYCGHKAKSSSGRTLHRKKCKAINGAIEAAKKLKIGDKHDGGTIKDVHDGLVQINDDVFAANKIGQKTILEDDMDIFAQVIKDYKCPYCGNEAKSPSGRTLHLKSCKAISTAKDAAKKFEVGDDIQVGTKIRMIVDIQDGLLLLADNRVRSAHKVNKIKVSGKISSGPAIPKNPHQWVSTFCSHYPPTQDEDNLRWRMGIIYRTTTYAKRRWPWDDIENAMNKYFKNRQDKNKKE